MGAYFLLGSIFEWKILMNNKRVKIANTYYSHNGVRILYGILGAILLITVMY